MCPPFSCGHLQDISYPFRRQGDPVECGVREYELICSSSGNATIQIDTGTYYVTAINNGSHYFSVMDANFHTSSSCPLPMWNHFNCCRYNSKTDSDVCNLCAKEFYTACFANCSRAITNNSVYKPVDCLSANNSHVYVWVSEMSCRVDELEPYCGYLAMSPLSFDWLRLQITSYEDITQLIRKGFVVRFPIETTTRPWWRRVCVTINRCLNNSIR